MTTRRHLLTATALTGAALLTGCREPATDRPAAASVPDLLLAATSTGLAAVRGQRVLEHAGPAVAAPDAQLVYRTTFDADGTILHTFEGATGAGIDRAGIAGRWVPRVTSPDGRLVVLTPPGPSDASAGQGGRPSGRERSTLLIADRSGERYRFELAGTVEADAFTAEGAALFVLEWLPAHAPDRYRVRLLDFADGTTQPLLTRDKQPVPAGAEEEMRGDGRHAVLSPDRKILYTLYTHQPDHQHTRDLVAGRPGGVHAFVHVLHLEQRWAYCLDLPHPFGEGPVSGHALAVSRDGRRLVVVDTTSGRVATADTGSLTVSGVSAGPVGPGPTSLVAAAAGTRVFVGSGAGVHAVDPPSGVGTTWRVPTEVRGLAAGPDGKVLYVADAGGISWLDVTSGAALGRIPVPGLTGLHQVS